MIETKPLDGSAELIFDEKYVDNSELESIILRFLPNRQSPITIIIGNLNLINPNLTNPRRRPQRPPQYSRPEAGNGRQICH
jgi:hypothetical protein